jgi:hypothetical protein
MSSILHSHQMQFYRNENFSSFVIGSNNNHEWEDLIFDNDIEEITIQLSQVGVENCVLVVEKINERITKKLHFSPLFSS